MHHLELLSHLLGCSRLVAPAAKQISHFEVAVALGFFNICA